MNNNIWHPEDGALLQQLRISAQLDELVFARSNTISLSQLRELEGQGQGSFYTAHIKSHTGFKLLRKLGHEPVLRRPILVVPEVEEALAMAEQTVMPTPVQLPVPNQTMFAPGTATAFTTGPSESIKKPDTAIPAPQSPNWRFAPQWAFTVLLLTAGMWAVVNTPWSSLIALKSPGVGTTSLQFNPTSATLDTAPHVVDFQSSSQNALQSHVSHTQFPTAPLNTSETTTPQPQVVAQACDWRHQASSFVYEPMDPVKSGNYIHFVALQDGNVCVRDQQNQLTTLQLKAGMAKSVYGAPPFLVHSPSWSSLQLFYQGRKVMGTPTGEAHWLFKNKSLPAHGLTLLTVTGQMPS